MSVRRQAHRACGCSPAHVLWRCRRVLDYSSGQLAPMRCARHNLCPFSRKASSSCRCSIRCHRLKAASHLQPYRRTPRTGVLRYRNLTCLRSPVDVQPPLVNLLSSPWSGGAARGREKMASSCSGSGWIVVPGYRLSQCSGYADGAQTFPA